MFSFLSFVVSFLPTVLELNESQGFEHGAQQIGEALT